MEDTNIRMEGMIFTMAREELLAFIGSHSKGSRIEKRQATRNPYKESINTMTRLMNSKEPVIVTERGMTDTYVVHIDYVGDLWCKGFIRCLGGQEEATIPYTIRYSDLMTEDVKVTEVT